MPTNDGPLYLGFDLSTQQLKGRTICTFLPFLASTADLESHCHNIQLESGSRSESGF